MAVRAPCKNCGHTQRGGKFCGWCGIELESTSIIHADFCVYCGNQFPPNVTIEKQCPECGGKRKQFKKDAHIKEEEVIEEKPKKKKKKSVR